jgi:lipopolysaccharide heptosyltransferase II
MTYENILVLNRIHIGDCLFTTPALRALRAGFPRARIVVTVPESNRDLFLANPSVDEILPRPRRGLRAKQAFLRAVRERGFDLVISFQERTLFYALATRRSGAKMSVATLYWPTRPFYRRVGRRVFGEHEVEKYATLVEALGLPRPSTPPELHVCAEHAAAAERLLREKGWRDGERLIGLNPGATQDRKRWPPERFAAVGDRLAADHGCRIAVFGGPGDRELAERVTREMAAPAVSLAGCLRLGETAAALRRCALVISNDTGPMHMAAALGVPVLALFGPTPPNQFGPLGPHQTVLRARGGCPDCPPPCMHGISVEECLAAAERMLDPVRH